MLALFLLTACPSNHLPTKSLSAQFSLSAFYTQFAQRFEGHRPRRTPAGRHLHSSFSSAAMGLQLGARVC
jgi:hypothetical protein